LFEVILHEIKRKNLDRKIRVAAVSYLNTKPLIYGFEQGMMKDELKLVTDYPANIASMLINDEIDIALVPVASIPLLKEHHIITNYCIGTNGEVASVCLFSDVPLKNIDTILLDYQSMTSVGLLKILLKEYWKINPILKVAEKGYEENIIANNAGLVIGDRAFEQRHKSRYVYDLSASWHAMTGLPFVFAVWIANKVLPTSFLQNFNVTVGEGLKFLPAIIEKENYTAYDLEKYYCENISYLLDDKKREGMNLYLKKLLLL
jgi:chorismate dehydratase